MKRFTTALLSALVIASSAASIGARASTDPVVYTTPTASTVKVQVFQDNQPASGATVQLLSSTGKLIREHQTSQHGYTNFANLSSGKIVKVVATTGEGMTSEKWVLPIDNHDK